MSQMTHQTLTFDRIFDVPRSEVWAAWTQAERVSQWWGPEGVDAPLDKLEVDPRVGGVFRVTMTMDGAEIATAVGHFTEVQPLERLVSIEDEEQCQEGQEQATITTTFADAPGGGTQMTCVLTQYATEEMRQMATQGWDSCFDCLERHLAG